MMKRKSIFLMAFLLTAFVLTVIPASAQPATYEASGSLRRYRDTWSSEIIQGSWNVEVTDGDINFEGYYLERNLVEGPPENSPEGSIDLFILYDFELERLRITGDTLRARGTLRMWKWWAKMDGTREWRQIDLPARIRINSRRIIIDFEYSDAWLGQDFDIIGRTSYIDY